MSLSMGQRPSPNRALLELHLALPQGEGAIIDVALAGGVPAALLLPVYFNAAR
jgi:hypothetical protein